MSPNLGPFLRRAPLEAGLEDADTDKTPDVPKDEQLWFADGNIVVVAANEVAFRINKGTLSLRSEVFHDLFSLVDTDAATAEIMDGCPVVRVTDSPKDIRHLFLVLCCGKNYYYSGDEPIPIPFAALAALIRTAHKYSIPNVLTDALARLKKFYTNNLAAWRDPTSRARYVVAADSDATTAVNLARLTDTPTVLPTAILVCTQVSSKWITNRADNSRVLCVTALSDSDRALVTEVKAFLMQMCASRAFSLLGAIPSAQCTTRLTCEATRNAPLDALAGDPFGLDMCMSDELALTPMADVFWARYSHWPKFCASCKAALVKKDEELIKLLWHHLPECFGLRIGKDSWPGGSAAESKSTGSQ